MNSNTNTFKNIGNILSESDKSKISKELFEKINKWSNARTPEFQPMLEIKAKLSKMEAEVNNKIMTGISDVKKIDESYIEKLMSESKENSISIKG